MQLAWRSVAILSVLVIGFTVSANQALAWTITADFESGSPGTLAKGPNAFHGAGDRTTFSNARAHSGSQSARMEWQKGDTGFHNARGDFGFPTTVSTGEQIWGRAYFYFQSPWRWTSVTQSGNAIKIFRFHKKKSDGSNGGYISIYGVLNWAEPAAGQPRGDCENCWPWNLFQDKTLPVTILKPDQWYSLEHYVYFHPTKGIYRLWINGELKVEELNFNTANNSTTIMDFAFLMSYWNGGAPQNQVQYIDDIMITTNIPSNRDAAGNPTIGPAPVFLDAVAPAPPKGLRIQ